MTRTRRNGAQVMQPELSDATLGLEPPVVMGVLNVTPDSFSDGGRYDSVDAAVERTLEMFAEGAALVDIGGESTRPGAAPVSVAEETDRVVGVIEAIRRHTDAPLSVDTSKPEVMRAAVNAGASLINDVRALRLPHALETAAALGVPVCLMHMQGEPGSMQDAPAYDDVVAEVSDFLTARAAVCMEAGIPRDRILLDPGFGFGKRVQHNLALLHNLDRLVGAGYPVLAGMSRKSMISDLLKREGVSLPAGDAHQRIGGSVTLALYAARKGAHILRVHDVRQTVEALTIDRALNRLS